MLKNDHLPCGSWPGKNKTKRQLNLPPEINARHDREKSGAWCVKREA